MNKKLLSWIAIVVGGIAAVFGMVYPFERNSVGGTIFGIGFIVFFLGLNYLVNVYYDKKHPKQARAKEIELKDERNQAIMYRSKAKAGDLLQWMVMGVAYVNIFTDGALWLTLLLVGIFTLKIVIDFALRANYQNKM